MDYKKASLVLAVIRSLKQHGSWTGKTHVQKSLFLIKTATQIDVPFTFVLFKHGPYSFELETELEQMKSYLAITSEPDPNGYGVVLSPGPGSRFIDERGGLSDVESMRVGRVCRFVGQRNVSELEHRHCGVDSENGESRRLRVRRREVEQAQDPCFNS